ncbi:hypothetical protein [Variovorax paradoxus]|uniref:Uncharacterized protein n=1 Tax=Variovorax paradoxus (strain EPS) TaxID=595537 RepID=E6V9S3_VARPE|nr:hypothetical protein [Variovorax paradoxus]ADU36211.1 hypothetical protein Varpa_2003 [Variovorax paradoxus EPS]
MADARKSTTALVLEAVQDLHAQEQIVTRETLAELTGLKLSVIDDRVGTLADDGAILRVQRGVYVPAPQHPPARPMSKTVMPNGMVKIEIGDDVLTLTPREDRSLANLMAGAAAQAAAIEAGRNSAILAAELGEEVKRLRRQVNALEVRVNPGQGQLFAAIVQTSKEAANGTSYAPLCAPEAKSR